MYPRNVSQDVSQECSSPVLWLHLAWSRQVFGLAEEGYPVPCPEAAVVHSLQGPREQHHLLSPLLLPPGTPPPEKASALSATERGMFQARPWKQW